MRRRAIVAFFMLFALLALAACRDDAAGPRPAAQAQAAVGDPEPEVVVSTPKRGSPRALALDARTRAEDLVLYSVESYSPPRMPARPQQDAAAIAAYDRSQAELFARSHREWCTREECLHRNRILGRTPVRASVDREAVLTALRESLGQVPDYATACVPEYRHAVTFHADGHRFDVLLCFRCGQVAVAIDGDIGSDEQTYRMGDEAALDAILVHAGIALAPKW